MLRKKLTSVILAIALAAALIPFASPSALAAGGSSATSNLHALGLFQGVGDNADGTPNFALDRVPTRNEAVTMLVRLLGKENEALNGTWTTPFTDVANWARPYVGYAYVNELTTGTSATTFSGTETITASQYITFVLRALGYSSGSDFAWDKAWELSDELGFTHGEYSSASRTFTRGDVAEISLSALTASCKDSDKLLYELLIENGAITSEAAARFIPQPLNINGRRVVSVQSYFRMTMGGARSECQTTSLISELYQLLLDSMGGEVEAPEMFGEMIYLDAPDYYYMNREISFMESAGLEGTVIQKYVLYSWLDAGYPNVSLPLGQWLIHDATHDKWYRLTKDIFSGDLERIYERGDWVEIFNNIV